MGREARRGMQKKISCKSFLVVPLFGGQFFCNRSNTHPFPHHHWENFPTKMKWRTHWLTIDYACPMWTHTLITHSSTQHTLIIRSRANHALVKHLRKHHGPTMHSHIDIHSLYTHALTACSHTYHSITIQSLNDHGFTTHSPCTPPSPRSLHTHHSHTL